MPGLRPRLIATAIGTALLVTGCSAGGDADEVATDATDSSTTAAPTSGSGWPTTIGPTTSAPRTTTTAPRTTTTTTIPRTTTTETSDGQRVPTAVRAAMLSSASLPGYERATPVLPPRRPTNQGSLETNPPACGPAFSALDDDRDSNDLTVSFVQPERGLKLSQYLTVGARADRIWRSVQAVADGPCKAPVTVKGGASAPGWVGSLVTAPEDIGDRAQLFEVRMVGQIDDWTGARVAAVVVLRQGDVVTSVSMSGTRSPEHPEPLTIRPDVLAIAKVAAARLAAAQR